MSAARRMLAIALGISVAIAGPGSAAASPKRTVLGPTWDSRNPHAVRVASGVTFAPYMNVPIGSWPESVAIGDFTGDGRNDVAMSTTFYFDAHNDYKVFLFVQNHDGTLASPVRYRTDIGYGESAGLAAGDLNGDGKTDLALATGLGVDVFYQSGGTLLPRALLKRQNSAQVEIGDVVGGKRLDLIACTGGKFTVFQGTSSGLLRTTTVAVDATEFEVGDVTNDGRPDVVTFYGPTVTVVKQEQHGAFAQAATYPVQTGDWPDASGLEVADVNGDGLNDAVATIGGNQPGALVNVFLGQDDGTFVDPVVYGSYDIPEPVESADLNGDGLADTVVAHGGWNEAGIYLQQGDGTLGAEELLPIPYASHYNDKGLAIGDINHDGKPDIVIADHNNGLVVLRQT